MEKQIPAARFPRYLQNSIATKFHGREARWTFVIVDKAIQIRRSYCSFLSRYIVLKRPFRAIDRVSSNSREARVASCRVETLYALLST